VRSDPPPMNPPAQEFIDAPAPTEATQEQPAGQSPIASDTPPLHNTVSISPPPTPQIHSQKVDDRSDLISPENHGRSAGTDESQDARLPTSSKEMLQLPPPDADDSHSGSDPVPPENGDGGAGMDEGPNETSNAGHRATLQDPPSHTDYNCAGSRTDSQDTLSSGNASGGDAGNEGSGELSIRKLVVAVAEIDVGSDFNRRSDGNDEGNYCSKTRQEVFEASGMLLVSTLPTRIVRGLRFDSECR